MNDITLYHDEITIRLLQNGRYTWAITTRSEEKNADKNAMVARLKELDGCLRDQFPNHVKENSMKFREFSEE